MKTMILKDNLDTYIATAMTEEEKSKYKLKVLRLIKAEYQKFLTSGKDKVLDEATEIKILKKLQKQWKEELEAFINAGRETFDLTLELKYLETFIPKEMSEEEQKNIAQSIIDKYLMSLPVDERKTMKHLGAIMKIINTDNPMINGKLVSEVYRKTIGL